MDRAYAALKEATQYLALAEDHLQERAAELTAAQQRHAEAVEEKKKAADKVQQTKRTFDLVQERASRGWAA